MNCNTIYTITFSPALDIDGSVENLIPDEKNYVFDERRAAGGNGINAARIAQRLNADVVALGFLGGATGAEIRSILDQEKIKHNFTSIVSNTRINLTVSNQKSKSQTRLSFPGASVSVNELEELRELCSRILHSSIVVIGGSLPKGVTSEDISSMTEELTGKGILCMIDIPGHELKGVVASRPFFIKPNLLEFQELVGEKVETIAAILPIARELSQSISLVCISSVEGGALLVTKNKVWFGILPEIEVKSTVGAGDSMVGSIAAYLSNNQSSNYDNFVEIHGDKILRWGLAAACATLVKPGLSLGDKDSILKYFPKIQIKELEPRSFI